MQPAALRLGARASRQPGPCVLRHSGAGKWVPHEQPRVSLCQCWRRKFTMYDQLLDTVRYRLDGLWSAVVTRLRLLPCLHTVLYVFSCRSGWGASWPPTGNTCRLLSRNMQAAQLKVTRMRAAGQRDHGDRAADLRHVRVRARRRSPKQCALLLSHHGSHPKSGPNPDLNLTLSPTLTDLHEILAP